MLKGISPLISPELIKVLWEMGHGDEIDLAEANFPSETTGKRVIRADGIGAADLLKAILPLFPLDTYEKDRFILMEVVPGDPVVPVIWDEYKEFLERIKNKSIYKSDISVNENDKIITLSTCSYEFDDARLVVTGKLIDKEQ